MCYVRVLLYCRQSRCNIYQHQWRLSNGLHLDMIRCTVDVNFHSQSNKKGEFFILCKLKHVCCQSEMLITLVNLHLEVINPIKCRSAFSFCASSFCLSPCQSKIDSPHSRVIFWQIPEWWTRLSTPESIWTRCLIILCEISPEFNHFIEFPCQKLRGNIFWMSSQSDCRILLFYIHWATVRTPQTK